MDDSGFPRTPNRLFKLCGSHVQQSEALRAMKGACGPYNLGGSATDWYSRSVTPWFVEFLAFLISSEGTNGRILGTRRCLLYTHST
jgi:hypothetical protein